MYSDDWSDSEIHQVRDYTMKGPSKISNSHKLDSVTDSCSKCTLKIPTEEANNFNELSSIYENTEEELCTPDRNPHIDYSSKHLIQAEVSILQ